MGLQLLFTYVSDFDDNGIFFWLGTNGRTATEWANPSRVALVLVTSIEGRQVCARGAIWWLSRRHSLAVEASL